MNSSGVVLRSACNRDLDRRARYAAHAIDRVVEIVEIHRHVIDGDDRIARLDTCLRGRTFFNRIDDAHYAVVQGDFDADTGVFAAGADANFAELFRIQKCRVRIQVGHQSANGRFDQFIVGNRFDVVATDTLQHFGQQSCILPAHRRRRLLSRRRFDLAFGLHRAPDRQTRAQQDAAAQDQHIAKVRTNNAHYSGG